jgi:hypothetical protein
MWGVVSVVGVVSGVGEHDMTRTQNRTARLRWRDTIPKLTNAKYKKVKRVSINDDHALDTHEGPRLGIYLRRAK